MSWKMRIIRLAFTASVVCLQLFLLPASQLLHVACDHTHHSAGSASHPNGERHHQTEHAHCSHHHHEHGAPANNQERDQNSHFPHDSGSCAICQIILAAQIDELHEVQLPSGDLILRWVPRHQSSPAPTLAYALPVRGPPA